MPEKVAISPKIRLALSEDASEILEIYRPIVQNTTTSFELEIPDIGEMSRRIETTLVLYPWLVMTGVMTGQERIMGYAYAGAHRSRWAYQWSTELSVYVQPDFYRQQVGSSLYRSLMAILKLQGYCNFLAGVTLPNQRSMQFHQALGFNHLGTYHQVGFKFNRWHDVAWLELRAAGPAQPVKPITIQEVVNLPEWNKALNAGLQA